MPFGTPSPCLMVTEHPTGSKQWRKKSSAQNVMMTPEHWWRFSDQRKSKSCPLQEAVWWTMGPQLSSSAQAKRNMNPLVPEQDNGSPGFLARLSSFLILGALGMCHQFPCHFLKLWIPPCSIFLWKAVPANPLPRGWLPSLAVRCWLPVALSNPHGFASSPGCTAPTPAPRAAC